MNMHMLKRITSCVLCVVTMIYMLSGCTGKNDGEKPAASGWANKKFSRWQRKLVRGFGR